MACLLFTTDGLSADEAPVTSSPPPLSPPNFSLPTFDSSRHYNVIDFGATGKGIQNDTPSINKAIEKCAADGGGSVVFPAGIYLAASIHIRSNVQLLLDPQAVLLAAPEGFDPPEANPCDKYQDFGHSHFHDAFLWGEDVENFAIIGGTINGRSLAFGDIKPGGADKQISIKTGKNILFKDVIQKNGGHFVYLLNNCENVTLSNVTIKGSRDAVDLMSCRNVQISGCHFTGCGDDTIGVKSDYALGKTLKSENIYVWDSVFESGCNALQFGSETAGDFHNINFWNITITRSDKAGIGITSCDGAVIDGVQYRDITMQNIANPIYMLVINRLRTGDPARKVGTIKNVTISNVVATHVVSSRHSPANPCTISGRPDAFLENITLDHVTITCNGGGAKEQAQAIPPYTKEYAPKSLGPMPAAGLFARNVKGLQLRDVKFVYLGADERPSLVVSHVDGLTLANFVSGKPTDEGAMKLDQVTHLTIR